MTKQDQKSIYLCGIDKMFIYGVLKKIVIRCFKGLWISLVAHRTLIYYTDDITMIDRMSKEGVDSMLEAWKDIYSKG